MKDTVSQENRSSPLKDRLLTKRNLVVVAPAAALILSVVIAVVWISAPARPPRKMPPQVVKQVEVLPLKPVGAAPTIQAYGEVIAARSAIISAEVSGRIVSVLGDLAPGTVVAKGDILLSIDDSDYQLVLLQARASLAEAKASYEQELGEQAVSNRELQILTKQKLATGLTEKQRNLILRHPQMAKAKALVDSAEASVKKAELDVERTQIRAPFDGVISEKLAEVGAQVSASTSVLLLLDTREYWIKVSVPTQDSEHLVYAGEIAKDSATKPSIAMVAIQGDLATATSTLDAREGVVYQRFPELNASTRQTQILIRVPDPLALNEENRGATRLMVNDYVSLSITGKPMENVFVVDESHVHSGNQLWFFEQGELRIKTIEPVWRQSGQIFFNVQLREGDQLVTTDIANAYDGLKISLLGSDNAPKKHGPRKLIGDGHESLQPTTRAGHPPRPDNYALGTEDVIAEAP